MDVQEHKQENGPGVSPQRLLVNTALMTKFDTKTDSQPHLIKNGILEPRLLARIFGEKFYLSINQHKKLESFMKQTDHLVPEPKYTIRAPGEKCAVIVETRRHRYLSYVLRNVTCFLDDTWGLHIFHSPDNEEYVKGMTRDWGEVQYTNVSQGSFSKKNYNSLLTSIDFWKEIGSEHVLVFQVDSLLRRKGVDEFLEYDYVGAPWRSLKAPRYGGNGGLSLRRKSAMLGVLKEKNVNGIDEQEDIFFCRALFNGGYNLASRKTAMQFSVEEIYYPDPVGTHMPRQLLNSEQIDALLLGIRYN
jgi:hypothetical protein